MAGWLGDATTSLFDFWLRGAFFAGFFTFVDRSSKFGFSIASAKLLLVSLIFVTAFDFVVVLFPLRAAFFDGEVPGFVLGALLPLSSGELLLVDVLGLAA